MIPISVTKTVFNKITVTNTCREACKVSTEEPSQLLRWPILKFRQILKSQKKKLLILKIVNDEVHKQELHATLKMIRDA